jgi:ankyrin repeat protein
MKGSRAIIWLAVGAWTCVDAGWAQARKRVTAMDVFAAIQCNDLDFAKRNMTDVADLNSKDLLGNTLIHALIAPDKIELTKKNKPKPGGNGPRIVSIKKIDVSRELDNKIAIDSEVRLKVIGWLVRHGVPINEKNATGETPLHLAVKPEILNTILHWSRNKASENQWELEPDPRQSRHFIECLLNLGADPLLRDNKGNTPILLASFDLLPLLIGHGADINDRNNDGMTVFLKQTLAMESSHSRLRIDAHGVYSINREQWYSSTGSDWEKLAERLLALGVDINQKDSDGCSALARFISKGYTNQVRFMIEHGADVNAIDKSGVTMLHEAVLKRDLPLMELLLQKGAAANARTRYGETPLFYSLFYKDSAELLFRHHADPRIPTMRGENALHRLVEQSTPQYLEMLSLFIRNGAPLNQKNTSQRTPLSLAYGFHNIKAMEMLLQAGADPSISEYPGFSLLDQAGGDPGQRDALILLRKYGARHKRPWSQRHRQELIYGYIGLGLFPLFTFLFSLFKPSSFTKKILWLLTVPAGCWLLILFVLITKIDLSYWGDALLLLFGLPPLAALLMSLSGTRALADRSSPVLGIPLSFLNAAGCMGLTLGVAWIYFPGTKGEGGLALVLDALYGGGAAAVITLIFAIIVWKKRLART